MSRRLIDSCYCLMFGRVIFHVFATTGKATVAFTGVKLDGQDFVYDLGLVCRSTWLP